MALTDSDKKVLHRAMEIARGDLFVKPTRSHAKEAVYKSLNALQIFGESRAYFYRRLIPEVLKRLVADQKKKQPPAAA